MSVEHPLLLVGGVTGTLVDPQDLLEFVCASGDFVDPRGCPAQPGGGKVVCGD